MREINDESMADEEEEDEQPGELEADDDNKGNKAEKIMKLCKEIH